MTNDQLKTRAVEKLADSGVWVNRYLAMRLICKEVGLHTGVPQEKHENMYRYLSKYIGAVPITKPREPWTHRPPSVSRAMAHNLSRARQHQPALITPNGIGNERQSSGYGPKMWG